MSITLTPLGGQEEVLRALRDAPKKARSAAAAVLDRLAARILAAAKDAAPVEPEDGGALRDSIRRTRVYDTKTGVGVMVVAGGAPLEASLQATHHREDVYAIVQHEDLTLAHTTGGPKFVERPIQSIGPSILDELPAELDAQGVLEA